jgi:hypothetical protein
VEYQNPEQQDNFTSIDILETAHLRFYAPESYTHATGPWPASNTSEIQARFQGGKVDSFRPCPHVLFGQHDECNYAGRQEDQIG